MKTATHKFIDNQTVKFKMSKDAFQNTIVIVVFSNGEKTTMTEKRFNDIYQTN